MISTLHLSTGAYCSSRRPDITIANRSSCQLRSFSPRSIHPFNLALSSLHLLPHYPWWAPIPSQMSTNTNIHRFNKHFRQQLWTTEGLTEKEDETPLSHWGYHHDVFQFVFCRRKVNSHKVSICLSFFHQKRLVNWICSKQLDVLYTSFWSKNLEVLMNLSPSAIEQTHPSKWNGKNLKDFLSGRKVER